jgi:hypothetical protein
MSALHKFSVASSFKKKVSRASKEHKNCLMVKIGGDFNYNFIAMGEDNFQKSSHTVNTLCVCCASQIYHFTAKFVDINLKILIKMPFSACAGVIVGHKSSEN